MTVTIKDYTKPDFMDYFALNLPTEEHRAALIKTLDLMESGKLTHIKINDDDLGSWRTIGRKFCGLFNMERWCATTNCGTSGCIAGTAELLGKVSFEFVHILQNFDRPLYNLFYPDEINVDWAEITVAQAARALRSYLTTGKPNWTQAIEE